MAGGSTARTPGASSGDRFRPYPSYKDSGLEWVGEIPAHWDMKRLKFSAPLRVTKFGAKPKDSIYVGLENIESWTGRLLLEDELNSAESIVGEFKIGDVLFGKLRPYLAKAARPEFDGVSSSELLVLQPEEYSQDYLFYCLLNECYINWIDKRSYGTKMPRVGPGQVSDSCFLCPPLYEQRLIARFLDRETGKIDALVAKKERLIELLTEKRAALITQAVTNGLDPDVPMRDSGVDWLGEIPEHWKVKPIQSLARPGYRTFTDGDWIESPFITDKGIRLIQTGNIGIGYYKEQGFRYISDETFSDLDCTEVMPGDVIICRLAEPVGRACIAPNLGCRMITSVDVCILRPKSDVDSSFLVYLLSANDYLAFLGAICRGGTRDRVSRSGLGTIRVRQPPFSEQRAIRIFLDRETARIDELVAKVREAIDQLKELRTALISASVTGQIDLRDAAT